MSSGRRFQCSEEVMRALDTAQPKSPQEGLALALVDDAERAPRSGRFGDSEGTDTATGDVAQIRQWIGIDQKNAGGCEQVIK